MKKIAWLLAAAVLVAGPALAATPKDTVVMAKQIDDIISLDPAESFEFSGSEAVGNVYERLIAYDFKDVSKLKGELAESWSVGADGKTYTFKMKKGIKFHSGNPVTAEDAAYSLQRAVILNKSPGFILTQFGFTKENVKEKIRATDDQTLVIETADAVAPTFFYYCLTATVGSVVDSKVVQGHDKGGDYGNEWLKTNSAASGPFKVVSWKASESYTLERWDGYHGTKAIPRRVVVRHVPEPATQRLLLEKGDVDYARNLTKDQLDAIKGNANIVTKQGPKGSIYYVSLNQKNPTLAKPEVREALKYLVDYAGIEENIVRGRYSVHQAFLPAGFLGAIDDKPYKFDLAKAKALLAKAGVPDGFSVTMDVRNNAPTTDIAQAIQASWAKAGVKVELLPGDGKQVLTKYRARNHDIYIGSVGARLPGSPHQRRDLRDERGQHGRHQVEDARLAEQLGHPGHDEDDPGRRPREGRQEARGDVPAAPAGAPEDVAVHHHVPGDRGRRPPQGRRRAHHRAELREQPLPRDQEVADAGGRSPVTGAPAASTLPPGARLTSLPARVLWSVARLLGTVALTFLGLLLVTFLIGRVVPIDPVLAAVGDRAPAEVYERVKHELGLHLPLWQQFWLYLEKVLTGDFGRSVLTSNPVLTDIRRVFPATIELATVATLIGVALGIPMGVVAAVARGRMADHAVRVVSLLGYSVPVFWLGLMGLLLFYARLGWVAGPGRLDVAFDDLVPTWSGLILLDSALAGEWEVFWNALSHVILPASILGYFSLAYVARMTRSFMLAELGQEYVTAARIKGLSERRIVWRHAFGNVLVPLITVIALAYANLLEGSVLTETVFAWPGLGQYITSSLLSADMNAVLGGTIVVGTIFIGLNLLSDLLYRLVDPRAR